MVTRIIGISMDRAVKLRGGGQSHEHQKENQQDRSQAPERASAETRDFPDGAHSKGKQTNMKHSACQVLQKGRLAFAASSWENPLEAP